MSRYLLSLLFLCSLVEAKGKLCYQVGTFVHESEYLENISADQAEAIVAKALRQNYSAATDYPKLPNSLGKLFPQSPKTYIHEQVKEALLTQDFVSGLRQLGILGTSSSLELVEKWWRNHPLTSSVLESTAWNTFSLYFFGTLIHAPRLQTLRQQLRRPELIERIRREGFDSVYPQLYEKYGTHARFDLAYETARTAYYRVLLVQLVRLMWIYQDELKIALDPRTWIFFRAFANASAGDLEKKQEETFEENKVRREQFNSFREAYVDSEGPFNEEAPRPWEKDYAERVRRFPASYREEADRTWKTLSETPAKDLKAHWGPEE